MKELMIHVEEAVRPLRLPQGMRRKMREELLAHLQGIFEEERERLGDDEAAVRAAIERFGPADELSRKLREAVRWYAPALSYITASKHGVLGQRRSLARVVLFAVAGCCGMLLVHAALKLVVNPGMPAASFAIPFLLPLAFVAMSNWRWIECQIHKDEERGARTGEWERLDVAEK